MSFIRLYLLVSVLFISQSVFSEIIEEQIKTDVQVKNIYDREIQREVISHVIRHANKRSPILIFNHGRGPTTLSATAPNYFNRCHHANFFLDYGFAVVAPMRIGYGVTGGPDIEDTQRQRFGYETTTVGANQVIKVIEHLSSFEWADTSKVVVLGQSVGGMVSMNLSTLATPKIELILNFAGGQGGNPDTQRGEPTNQYLIKEIFKNFGLRNIVPTYWFYSTNDAYWGEKYPKEWFSAFRDAGGKGEFVSLSPYSDDGHGILCGNREAWQDDVSKILEKSGYTKNVEINRLIDGIKKVPFLKDTGRDSYKTFLNRGVPRAFAINESGHFGWATGPDSKHRALENCNKRLPNTCKLYAVDYEIVWTPQ